MLRLSVLALVAGLTLAACSGATDDPTAAPTAATGAAGTDEAGTGGEVRTLPRPAFLADLPEIQLVAPGGSGAGEVPVFSWEPVADAAEYRLSVLDATGPRWAWQGETTSVRYGAVEEGQNGPTLVAGSWWSVAAIDAHGEVVALSDFRAVSPADDPGTDPAWAGTAGGGGTEAGGSTSTDAPTATDAPGTGPRTAADVHPCDLLSGDDLATVLGGGWSDPEETIYPAGKGGSCSWDSLDSKWGGGVRLSIGKPDAYNPDGWDGESDPVLEGIGEEAYLTRGGMDRKVGFRRGELSVLLTFDYGTIDFERFAELGRLVDSRLQ